MISLALSLSGVVFPGYGQWAIYGEEDTCKQKSSSSRPSAAAARYARDCVYTRERLAKRWGTPRPLPLETTRRRPIGSRRIDVAVPERSNPRLVRLRHNVFVGKHTRRAELSGHDMLYVPRPVAQIPYVGTQRVTSASKIR